MSAGSEAPLQYNERKGDISLFVFFLIYFIKNPLSLRDVSLKKGNFKTSLFKGGPAIAGVGLILILITLSISIRNPIKNIIFPIKTTPTTTTETSTLNITSSGDIRKIVWRGSLDLFSKFPLFGTGVETFAYSYYWTRPVEHNLTSEWDFLYNKAHNEYLNYLATTGLVGTIPYLFLIFTVLFYLTKTSKKSDLSPAILSAFISILITNAAGFSVVTVSLFFFLLPALSLSQINQTNSSTNKFKKVLIIPIAIFFLIIITNNFSDYFADILYAKSQSADSQQDYASAYNFGQQSLNFSPSNPNYLIGVKINVSLAEKHNRPVFAVL
ncbi:MAG: O-antigen ligase family protein [Candidatus Moranbacteria bacterium]|nr:O-antigen ligase family protein [Candidatus Moranbacteria bacterium]